MQNAECRMKTAAGADHFSFCIPQFAKALH